MTHESEKSYSYRVRKFLEETYGKDNVHGNHYLSESVRYVDYYVEGPLANFAIEIENDFEACLKGTGQALIYAGELECVPLIIVPPDHIERPEYEYLNEHVEIVELDV